MKKILVTLCALLVSSNLFAYKYAIFTDQANHAKANEVVRHLQNTYPFNQFDIEYTVVDISSTDLGCAPDPQIARLPICNLSTVSTRAAEAGANQAMVVWDSPSWAGSGGTVPVISRGVPPNIMIHELLHTLGFADEYQYEASEASRYCERLCSRGTQLAINKARNEAQEGTAVETDPSVICAGLQKTSNLASNLAYIHPALSYVSDQAARSVHQPAIDWYARLGSDPITNEGIFRRLGPRPADESPNLRLGSGRVSGDNAIPRRGRQSSRTPRYGLFRAKTCDSADPPIPTWMPGSRWTLMDRAELGIGAEYEDIIISALESRGAQRVERDRSSRRPRPRTPTGTISQ